MLALTAGLVGIGCQKMDRPPMADYPEDTNPPGGPLKFYAAYDATNVDSIRANFGTDNNITYVEGVTGKAAQGATDGYIVYPSANDFKRSTSYTIAFWMKKNGPNPAGAGTSFAFGAPSTAGYWHQMEMFMLFEDAGNPSSAALAAVKFCINDSWYEFVQGNRIPNLLNNQWHHIAISYDAAAANIAFYVDGTPLRTLVPTLAPDYGKFTKTLDLSKMGGLVVGGAGHYAAGKTPDSWMGNFGGTLDQFRLYGEALSAAQVNELFTGKK